MLHEGGDSRFFQNDATALRVVTFYTMLTLNGAIPQNNMYVLAQENCNVMHTQKCAKSSSELYGFPGVLTHKVGTRLSPTECNEGRESKHSLPVILSQW